MIFAPMPRSALTLRFTLMIALVVLAVAVVAMAFMIDGQAIAGTTSVACNTPWIPVPGIAAV